MERGPHYSLSESFPEDFVCDLDWSCVAVNAALIAVVVVLCSFLLSQIVSRAVVSRARRLRGPSRRLAGDIELLYVPDRRLDAYPVALLRMGGRRGLRAQHFTVKTSGLLEILRPDEREAAFEHELAHIQARDDRYLPFFHALSSIVFFDPFLRQLRHRLGRKYEVEADEMAARKTRSPRVLARALLKLCEGDAPKGEGAAFLGNRRGVEILERIERLIALADRMDAGEI